MNKPTTMLMEEYKQKLIEVTNGSNLPPFLMSYILRDLLTEVESVAKQMAEKEKQTYLEEVEKDGSDE